METKLFFSAITREDCTVAKHYSDNATYISALSHNVLGLCIKVVACKSYCMGIKEPLSHAVTF
jgi:hypothetical protein